MNSDKIIVADDWTSNWQANIAVKITAIVLWGVIVVTFITLVAIVLSHEKELKADFFSATKEFRDEMNVHIADMKSPDINKIVKFLETEMQFHSFDSIEADLSGKVYSFGKIHDDLDFTSLQLSLPNSLEKNNNGELRFYYQPFRSKSIDETKNLIIGVAVAISLFGLFLTWVIHHVLSKPFQVLIDATKKVSTGDLETRVDIFSQDEFGHLAQFFNEMLIRINKHQNELLAINEDLKRENSERVDAERSLVLYRDHLEKTVEERTIDLAIARDQALKASKTKSSFLANMSHEIRTPLTAIIGFGESLLDEKQTESDKFDSVQAVIRNGRHLLTIINDILDMSKMEADKLDIETISMSPFHLLDDIYSLASMQACDKNLIFEVNYEFPLPKLICSDPTRLKQILLNLSANAIKFTSEGSVGIYVSCDKAAQKMTFVVKDSGIGLSSAAQERLFKAFSQADSSTTREFGGTGLGLFISKELAQLLGGDIKIESEEGVGSKFIVSISTGPLDEIEFIDDLSSVEESRPSPVMEHSQGSLHGSVLLAEDNPDNQRLIMMYLRRAGDLDVTVVENGSLAVEHALSNEYDLILMDMQMPVMGGLEAVQILRGTGYSHPIIALTANAMKEEQKSYVEAGCDGFLTKPIDQQMFFSVLSERLKNKIDSDQSLEDMSEDFQDEFQKLVRRFVERLPAQRIELEEAIKHKQWEIVSNIVHNLKGMGGGFGYPDITRLAEPLEKLLKAGEFSDFNISYSKLLAEIDRACSEAGLS